MILSVEKYNLEITSLGACSNFKLTHQSGEKLALNEEYRKLYIVSSKTHYLYVGDANTSINKRFQRGFAAYRSFVSHGKGRNGYKGYKWIEPGEKTGSLEVIVVIFKSEPLSRNFVEAIEGEIVYLIRKKTGEWPIYQNEIHFWQENERNETLGSKKLAAEIYNELILIK